MKIAPIADIKAHLSTYLKESEKGPIVITKNGKPIAVLLGIRDEDEIERLVLAYSPKFKSIMSKGRQQIQETGGVTHEDFWRELETESE
jgi:prevent-host-death family protein